MKIPSNIPEKPPATKSQPLVVPPPTAGPRRTEEAEYVPRYVALPRQWERGHGRRNLVGGVIVLLVALLLLAWAIHLAGLAAVFTVAACLATATLLYIMARSRLFRQRNGGFVAWAGVCLLGVSLVILHHGWLRLTGGQPSAPREEKPPVMEAVAPSDAPLLRDSFATRGDPALGPVVKILRDTKVQVDGKTYLVKTGELYPLMDVGVDEKGNSMLRFFAGDHDVLIAKGAAELTGNTSVPGLNLDATKPLAAQAPQLTPAKEFELPKGLTKKQQELASQQEAIRRYPDLGRPGSAINRVFLTAVDEQKHTGSLDFFDDPNWPLILAEILAEKDGWRRPDAVEQEPIPRAVPPPAPGQRTPN